MADAHRRHPAVTGLDAPVRPADRSDHRAPVALRAGIGLFALAVLAFNVVLMISDRAPRITRELFGGTADRLAARLDASDVDTDRLPGGDAIVHIGVWAVATMLVALTIWRWWALVPVGVALFVASVIVEFGQGRYSDSRAVEFSDVLANSVGVTCGVTGAALCMLVWSGLSRRIRGTRPPRR